MTLAFRNLKQSPEDPVAAWPTEAVQTALERGSLTYWRRLATEVKSDPWGPTARQLEEVLRHSRPYGVAEVMTDVIRRARADSERRERSQVAAEIGSLVAGSGMSREEFSRRIGTSASRLSTYLSGQVVPSAALLVRMRRVASRALGPSPRGGTA
ncbi:MAG: helix-turn-helix domain-containing protein [Acidimicrobiales bacterium]